MYKLISSWHFVATGISTYRTFDFDVGILKFIPDIGIMVRMFANVQGDLGSLPDRVIPKTLKMVLDASLLNTQHYKVRIKGKVEQSREMSSARPYTLLL